MRYYSVVIRNSAKQVVQFSEQLGKFSPVPGALNTWSSHDLNGLFIPNALNIELDAPFATFAVAESFTDLRIWGVGLPALRQANNLTNYSVDVFAGMKPPYDLNNAAKPGLLMTSTVLQGFGNWEGVEQYLELVLSPGGIPNNNSVTITANWKAGTDLGQDIVASLQSAYGPAYTFLTQVAPLTLTKPQSGSYTNLSAFSRAVFDLSSKLPGSQGGINIYGTGYEILIYDLSTTQPPITIQFADMIGQPTWIDAASITVGCVMRADIAANNIINFPTNQVFAPFALTTPQAATPHAPAQSSITLNGKFRVTEVHHFGNFRQPDAGSWRTQITATPLEYFQTFTVLPSALFNSGINA